jgi:hypothetical protein
MTVKTPFKGKGFLILKNVHILPIQRAAVEGAVGFPRGLISRA